MTEAYEKMHIRPEDVCKMTFSTIFSTFQSQVMQMGDCNASSTFQQMMTAIFKNFSEDSYMYILTIYSYTLKVLDVRGRPVFHSKNISEFFQLRPQTPSAFFGLRPPLSSRDTSEYFSFQAPSNSPQHYCALPPLRPLV